MYQAKTIRKISDPEIRELARRCNELEKVLRYMKGMVDDRRALGKRHKRRTAAMMAEWDTLP